MEDDEDDEDEEEGISENEDTVVASPAGQREESCPINDLWGSPTQDLKMG